MTALAINLIIGALCLIAGATVGYYAAQDDKEKDK